MGVGVEDQRDGLGKEGSLLGLEAKSQCREVVKALLLAISMSASGGLESGK